ncbi:hypothetical protein BAZMOX_02006_3 [methanotrophic endosymbiont of Bathymodiolus azoricus (Menez Gwen)]|nr:hypothetical protein BAZMOX_02006_3 [methanotrophic endosymbiont of Bathymodiolus azoricus (Menez Gwen)]
MYEAYLSKKHDSHNTIHNILKKLFYLIAWGNKSGIDIDSILLTGEMIEPKQVNAFGAWLTQRGKLHADGTISPIAINGILDVVSQAFRWFADQYVSFSGSASEREIHIKMYKDSIKERFSEQCEKSRKKNSSR